MPGAPQADFLALQAKLRKQAALALEEAAAKAGGKAKLARLIDLGNEKTHRQRLNNWLHRGTPVEFCLRIEKETGVRAERLAPFEDWPTRRKAAAAAESEF